MTTNKNLSRAGLALGVLLAATVLQGCAPLIVGGAAVGSAFMVTDRRSSGTQIDDEGIELKAGPKIREAVGDRGHINVTSFNRVALITGEVPSEADRTAVEQAVQRVENVRSTVNELAVAGNSSLTSRSNDAIITSKIKATYVDAKDLQTNTIKVVTERAVVYLMGIVTEREANRAADLAAGVSGVQKVVRVFEVISESDLAGLQKTGAPTTPAKQ
jgi:osmotically-inducible protein OsmY